MTTRGEVIIGQQNLWSAIALQLDRPARRCSERWRNHVDPTIIKTDWAPEETELLIEAHRRLGNKWTKIAALIPGRTEEQVKNKFCRAGGQRK